MLIVNLAPIDQSGRSLALAKYIGKQNTPVRMVSYPGERSHTSSVSEASEFPISYIYNIKTQKKGFLIRVALLIVKFLYITISVASHLLMYKISLFRDKPNARKSTSYFYNRGGSVIFVVPPTIAVIAPLILAKALCIRVIIDWHRISTGYAERFDRFIAGFVDNLSVTQEMQKYFSSFGIPKPLLLMDATLRRFVNRDSPKRKEKHRRKDFLDYLSSKYPEYKEKLCEIKHIKTIGVCSTSFSAEENIEKMLEDLKKVDAPQGGVLFLTTKHQFTYAHKNLHVLQIFLNYKDYLGLLGVADFGISTHQCRMDFPLKIVDYLESGLTVLAHDSTPDINSKKNKNASQIIRYTENKPLAHHLQKIYTRAPQSMRLAQIR